ncbi:MAG TPA: hypothetical protein VFN74_17220, partial [Chloroflexota bacterium]|nr:hypothetical protein [Chloroflexota bacterium]
MYVPARFLPKANGANLTLLPDVLLEIDDLRTHFQLMEGTVKAVDGASLTLRRGRTLAVVGESGCGK